MALYRQARRDPRRGLEAARTRATGKHRVEGNLAVPSGGARPTRGRPRAFVCSPAGSTLPARAAARSTVPGDQGSDRAHHPPESGPVCVCIVPPDLQRGRAPRSRHRGCEHPAVGVVVRARLKILQARSIRLPRPEAERRQERAEPTIRPHEGNRVAEAHRQGARRNHVCCLLAAPLYGEGRART
jgi:hypothetical protein